MTRRGERLAAAVVAGAAWAGLIIQTAALLARLGSWLLTLRSLSGYFTVMTNLLVAVVFTGVAAGARRFAAPRLIAGVALAIALVGAVYGLLLRGTAVLSGPDAIADGLLHAVTPVLGPLFWLVVTPKGWLRWRDPLLWALYPSAYLVYALVRGTLTGHYVYPFIDVAVLGWARASLNALLIGLGFVAAATALVALDRALAGGRLTD